VQPLSSVSFPIPYSLTVLIIRPVISEPLRVSLIIAKSICSWLSAATLHMLEFREISKTICSVIIIVVIIIIIIIIITLKLSFH
jgi:hypothetical protein